MSYHYSFAKEITCDCLPMRKFWLLRFRRVGRDGWIRVWTRLLDDSTWVSVLSRTEIRDGWSEIEMHRALILGVRFHSIRCSQASTNVYIIQYWIEFWILTESYCPVPPLQYCSCLRVCCFFRIDYLRLPKTKAFSHRGFHVICHVSIRMRTHPSLFSLLHFNIAFETSSRFSRNSTFDMIWFMRLVF